MAYEHQLDRFPVSLTVGPFGGSRNRDFLCVQCLDGSLIFHEQEVYGFSRSLKSRLLPEPIIYVPRNDVFITLGSDWIIECYRYFFFLQSSLNRSQDYPTRRAKKRTPFTALFPSPSAFNLRSPARRDPPKYLH